MIFKRDKTSSTRDKPLWLKIGGGVLALVLLLITGFGWYWSRTPDVFWVTQARRSADQ